MNRKISFRLVYKTEYTHIHLFIYIYHDYLSVCPPIVPFPTPHYPIPLLPPPMCSSVTMSLHTQSPMSLCHYGFCSPVTLSFTYSVHYVFRSFCLVLRVFYVNYFYKLTNLSRNSKQKIGQYLPFLSRTFRDKFVTIKNTIVYKIK